MPTQVEIRDAQKQERQTQRAAIQTVLDAARPGQFAVVLHKGRIRIRKQ